MLLVYFAVGKALFHPDDYVYTFGGDGAFIYYNLIFQTLYGHGWILENMNYPVFESVFMTDAQASFGLLFSFLESIFPGNFITRHPIGSMHLIQYLLIAFGAAISYLLLRNLNVSNWLSVIFGIGLVFLSPQLERFTLGHFGLAFPILFPLALLLFVKITKGTRRYFLHSFFLLCVLLFFGLNNVYCLILCAGLILLATFFSFWLSPNEMKNKSLIIALTSLSVILVFITLKISAPESDRIEWQWGYFENSIELKSLIYPQTSLLSKLFHGPPTNVEARVNIGILNITILSISFLMVVLFRKPFQWISKLNASIILSLFIASLIMLFYASGRALQSDFIQNVLGDKIQILTMFKASGRFAWPFYYCSWICSAVVLNSWLKGFKLKSNFKYPLLISVGVLAFAECYYYSYKYLNLKPQYGSPYKLSVLSSIKNDVQKYVDLNEIQAIYCLPVMEGWNDKFHIKPNFHTEYNATKLSMATGIPMINAMLSRIGLSDASRAIQFAAHPLFKKDLLELIDLEKNILLIFGESESDLTLGEQYLIDQSTFLKEYKHYSLHLLNPKELMNAQMAFQDSIKSRLVQTEQHYFLRDFNDQETTNPTLDGSPVYMIANNQSMDLCEVDNFNSDTLVCSLYLKLTNEKYGVPYFYVNQFANQQLLNKTRIQIPNSRDIVDNWIRISENIFLDSTTTHLKLEIGDVNQNFYIDNLNIQEKNSSLYIENRQFSKAKYYNNYLMPEG